MLFGVVVCFVLSGFAALLYQTAWLREFSTVFGNSELAVATVLAAYMAGLALGAAVAGRAVARIRRPLLVYGLLEAGIAISALAVPLLLGLAGDLYVQALGGRPDPPDAATFGQPIFYLVVGFLVLALPTSFMGATLPLLTRHAVKTDREVGPRVALLYASNTAGAVLGTLTAGFLLLPALGLRSTVRVGVVANALVFLIAAALSRGSARLAAEAVTENAPEASEPLPGFFRACVAPVIHGSLSVSERLRSALRPQAAWILPLMLISGATTFLYEVLWTRLLVHVLGGSIYAFTTMLATFLAGIALGGGLAGRLAANRRQAAFAFAATQLGIAALSMGIYTWMGLLIPDGREMSEMVGYAIVVMLPATVFIGATFPLAVRILVRSERDASAGAAWIYAWNTQGGIAGAVLAGFWIIPELGFEGSIKLAICVNGLLALLCLVCVVRPRPAFTGGVALAWLATLLLYHPARPQAVLAPAYAARSQLAEPRETFYAVGRSASVLMLDDGESHRLLTNGLLEADIADPGSPPARDAQKWLTALAVAARPDTDSLLVVGFGGGVALEGLPASVRRVDVVELEPEVIRANRTLAGQRASDPLADERVRVIINDARNALRLTSRRYDAIISQPSHPSTAGASHLFTREFVQSAKSHLNERGVFVQWMSASVVTVPLLRSLAATLLAEFRNVRLYRASRNDLLFLASDSPLDVELELARTGRPIHDEPLHYYGLGIHSVEDLVAALVTDLAGLEAFARNAPVITDDQNLMATHSFENGAGLTTPQLNALFAPLDPLLDPASWIHARLGNALSYPHLARQLIRMDKPSHARALSRLVSDPATRLLILAELQANAGDAELARRSARAALEADPKNMQARYFLFRQPLQGLRAEDFRAEDGDALAGLEGTALVVARAWRLARTQDWQALAEIDDALARSLVTDIWYPDAMLLRARWRLHMGRDRELFAAQALRLVDAAWLLGWDLELPLERMRIGAALGREDVLVESARHVVAVFLTAMESAEANATPLNPSQRAMMKKNLLAVVQALDREAQTSIQGAPPSRAEIVLTAARDVLRRLDVSRDP